MGLRILRHLIHHFYPGTFSFPSYGARRGQIRTGFLQFCIGCLLEEPYQNMVLGE